MICWNHFTSFEWRWIFIINRFLSWAHKILPSLIEKFTKPKNIVSNASSIYLWYKTIWYLIIRLPHGKGSISGLLARSVNLPRQNHGFCQITLVKRQESVLLTSCLLGQQTNTENLNIIKNRQNWCCLPHASSDAKWNINGI